MSSYTKKTKHPLTGKWEDALWIDDYFGKHIYGVKFPKTNEFFDSRNYILETKDPTTITENDKVGKNKECYYPSCKKKGICTYGNKQVHFLFCDQHFNLVLFIGDMKDFIENL